MKQNNNQQNKVKINWPNLYFFSLADQEKFIETTILTLRSRYYDTILHHVYNEMSRFEDINDPEFYNKVKAKTSALMNSGQYPVKEFIETDENGATVCINVKNIDTLAIEIALERLASLQEEIKPGMYIEFGEPISFKAEEILETFKKH